jgi:hypothetical protein
VLSFTPTVAASGSSVCNVTLLDSEGATSASELLTVTVTPGESSNPHTSTAHTAVEKSSSCGVWPAATQHTQT